jgi:hypothetical protein
MGHLLKIKCLDSRVNGYNKCPVYTQNVASAKFSTNSHEMDNSVELIKIAIFLNVRAFSVLCDHRIHRSLTGG